MSLSAAFEIGKAGVRIFQVASEVTAENIANVNTPGYSRQRVILESAPPTTHNSFPLGSGVKIATVERYYDALLQKQLVSAETTSGFNSKKAEVLGQLEPVFNEIAQDGLGAAITGFFNSWSDLSLNPTGQAERQGVLGRAQNLVDQFNYVARTLNDTVALQEESIQPQVNDINRMIEGIAYLNGQIKTTELLYGNANEIRDQRDFMIRELSTLVGVTFEEQSDGQTDVYITDNSLPRPGVVGPDDPRYYIVKGELSGKLNVTGVAPRAVTVEDHLGNVSNSMDPTAATPFFSQATSGGQLWATLTMRDVTIPEYQQKVDDLASEIVNRVNAQHITGFTPAGAAGGNVFNPAGTTAATIALALTSTTQIAASGSATAPGDNSKAVEMSQLISAQTMAGNTSSFNQYYNSLVSEIGLDVQTSRMIVKQDAAFMKQLVALRESQSGVSLDEELTNLIKYQRSYQASAKLITTAGEMMDTLINMMR